MGGYEQLIWWEGKDKGGVIRGCATRFDGSEDREEFDFAFARPPPFFRSQGEEAENHKRNKSGARVFRCPDLFALPHYNSSFPSDWL
jgi:hypothetical protein